MLSAGGCALVKGLNKSQPLPPLPLQDDGTLSFNGNSIAIYAAQVKLPDFDRADQNVALHTTSSCSDIVSSAEAHCLMCESPGTII
jgi:hypothetical protein